MLSYPFDPQCRLSSNWIPGEVVTAFISAKTRTIVPVHAPFFQNAVITKDGIELIEGIDFYFSLKHKVASEATCQSIYGGITLINDAIQLPVTIDYHPQGGSYEATYGQIYNYLETDPDIWDGSWESLINDSYYPPVNVLYNPELYVSEPAIIEACQLLTTTINSKDEQESLDFNLLKTRIASLTKDIKRLQVEEHTSATGNVHGTQPWHINAMSVSEPATNAAKLQGKSYTEFMDYVASRLVKLDTLITDLYRVNTEITTDTLLVNSGTLLLGDTTALLLTPESIAQYDDGAVILHADKECNSVGVTASLTSGVNKLEVVSSGTATNNRSLLVNGEEVITTESLRAFAQGILYPGNTGLVTQSTDTLQWTGDGSMDAPLEAIPKLPAATETGLGIIKVVNEGSHGYPCPGFSYPATAVVYSPLTKRGLLLRNGSDDLEHDVFVSWLDNTVGWVHTPTAERFRPANLPVTAIPEYVLHSTEDLVLLQTTEGPYILVTNKSLDYDTWQSVKVNGVGVNIGWEFFPQRIGNVLYLCRVESNNTYFTAEYWSAPWSGQTSANFTKRSVSGTNFSGTAQSGTVFRLFDKVKGTVGERCQAINPNADLDWYDVSRVYDRDKRIYGDCFDFVLSGTQLRVCHRGGLFSYNATGQWMRPVQTSYIIDLTTGAFTLDNPERYPIIVNVNNDLSIKTDNWLSGGHGPDWSNAVVRSGGYVFTYSAYYNFASPNVRISKSDVGISDWDNIKSGAHNWSVLKQLDIIGLYGTAIKMGVKGITPIGNNRLITINTDESTVVARYDPYGTYAPSIKGYGPSNDRLALDYALWLNLKRMIAVFDGENMYLEGAFIDEFHLSSYTSYDNDVLGGLVSITAEKLNAFKAHVISAIVTEIDQSLIRHSRIRLEFTRRPGVPQLGTLVIYHWNPERTIPRSCNYVFEFTSDKTIGTINTLSYVKKLKYYANNVYSPDLNDSWVANRYQYGTSSLLYKLKDGNWARVTCSVDQLGIDLEHSSQHLHFWSANVGWHSEAAHYYSWYGYGAGLLATKELGLGEITRLLSGEGTYLTSWGFTKAEIMESYVGSRAKVNYSLVMSRSDAGDNVAISQLAATEVRAKILSLMPPSRKVQGMDLSQDRVITREQIPNASNVPNVKDIDYPVLGKHTVTLADKALASHQHAQDDYIVTVASVDTSGYSVLGGPNSEPSAAVGPAMLNQLDINAAVLNSRPVSVNVLDSTITIDSTL